MHAIFLFMSNAHRVLSLGCTWVISKGICGFSQHSCFRFHSHNFSFSCLFVAGFSDYLTTSIFIFFVFDLVQSLFNHFYRLTVVFYI